MTCHFGPGIVICDGVTGDWTPTRAFCPWCCCMEGETVPAASREVYGGYCAPDMICGECGHRWSWDMNDPRRDTPDEKREANIATVKALTGGRE